MSLVLGCDATVLSASAACSYNRHFTQRICRCTAMDLQARETVNPLA